MLMKRRTVLKVTSASAAGASLAMVPMRGFAQTNWDLANEYEATSLHGEVDQRFAERLAELTDGEITITHHFGGALGYDSVDHFDAVGDGALPMADTLLTQLGGIDPIFQLSSLPFLIKNIEEARVLWQVGRPYYEEVFEANNQVLLYASAWPPSGIWANQPIRTVEDLRQLEIRTYDANGTRTLRASAASPQQLSWSDVVPQLQAGGINAVLTSAEGGVAGNLFDQLNAFTEINYASPLNVGHMNRTEFDLLSTEQQEAVQQAAQDALEFTWENVAARTAQNYETMRDEGMTVETQPSDELMAHLQDAADVAIQDWLERTGERGEQVLAEFRNEVGR